MAFFASSLTGDASPTTMAANERPAVWIVEDEPAAAELAADLCLAGGARPVLFRSALPFLRAFREGGLPRAVVLDWRLERELSAALFLATRHRFPQLPVIYWTGSPEAALPAAVRDDPRTRIVDKAAGTVAFDTALAWALAARQEPAPDAAAAAAREESH